MNNNKAELFCKRINKLSRYGMNKLIQKRKNLIEEFHATECSFTHTKYRIDDTIIEMNLDGDYEVRK